MSNRRPDPRVDPVSVPPERGEALRVDRVDIPARRVEAAALPSKSEARPAVIDEDARIAPLERRIQVNDWRGIATDLGPLDEIGKLPPNLRLLAALAHHEVTIDGSQQAVGVGVRCVAALLRVPEDSEIAGVVARRMFRKNPVKFSERKAPPARVSILIVVLTLVMGGTVGWLMSGGWGIVMRVFRAG
jgi:hypothetical protein